MYKTAKRIIRKGLAIGVLLLAVGYGGCATHKASADLNGDGIQDELIESPGTSHNFFVESNLRARLSKPDGTQQEELIAVFSGKPENIQFEDIDKDGDLDLIATQHSKTSWDKIVDGDYVARNDGQGNFDKLELIGN
jgi:hypothetical protein